MDNLLFQLRNAVIDENEPTAGLLRKCIVLGAYTGSEQLKRWARSELNGYTDQDELPVYRTIPAPILSMDFRSGNTLVRKRTISRMQIPENARTLIPEFLSFYHPLEELEGFTNQESVRFADSRLVHAQYIWNKELSWTQEILKLEYFISKPTFQGMVGKIRTSLVEVIAELTADLPPEGVPSKESVDKTFEIIIKPTSQIINNYIDGNSNQIAIGNGIKQKNTIQEVIDDLRDSIFKIKSHIAGPVNSDIDVDELYSLVQELDTSISAPQNISKEQGQSLLKRFQAFTERTSDTAFQALLSGAAQGVAGLLAQGFFS